MPGITDKAFREAQCVSKMTVWRWRNSGHVVVTPEGLIDAEATERRLRDAGLGKFRSRPHAPAAELALAQRSREIALARLRRQEWLRRSVQWIRREDASRLWREGALAVRASLEQVDEAAPARIAACKSASAVQGVLQEVVYAALARAAQDDQSPAEADPLEAPAVGVRDAATKVQAETAKTQSLALLRQLDVEIAAGTVLNVRAGLEAFEAALSGVRRRMLAIVGELPATFFGQGERQIAELLRQAIAEALEELPLELPPLNEQGQP